MHTHNLSAALFASTAMFFAATAMGDDNSELEKYKVAEVMVKDHIVVFDTLDFDVYTHQKWNRLKESHAPDILVHYPDGHTTKGLDSHIAELKPMFVFAPDTRSRVQ